jgi:hypothetical protein
MFYMQISIRECMRLRLKRIHLQKQEDIFFWREWLEHWIDGILVQVRLCGRTRGDTRRVSRISRQTPTHNPPTHNPPTHSFL